MENHENSLLPLTIMRFLNINVEQHIPHWFLTSTYEETYIPLIYPVNGPNVWEMNSNIDVFPPSNRILPGTPEKNRRLESWELHKDSIQLRQGGTRKRCEICRQIGHRRNGYPQAPKEPPTQPPTNPQTQPPPRSSQQTQPPTHGPETEPPIHIPAEAPTKGLGTQPPIHTTTEAAIDTPIQPPSTTTNPSTQTEPGVTQKSQAPPACTNVRPKLAYKRGPDWKP